MVLVPFGHGWQSAVNGFPAGVGGDVVVGHAPSKDVLEALPNSSGRLGRLAPYRGKDLQHVGLGDLV